MERPPRPRRSSILNQVAQREGIDLAVEKGIQELGKTLPPSAMAQATRLSGGLTLHVSRRSNAASNVGAATPVNKALPSYCPKGSSSKKVSSIPRPISAFSGRNALPATTFCASTNRSRMDTFTHQSALQSNTRRRSRSIQRDDRSSYNRTSGMSRANSMDSLCSLTFQTPITPRYAPKSPGKLTFLEKSDLPKNLKPPSHKDTKGLGHLAVVVKEFMIVHNCPQRLILDAAKKMSVAEYLDACRFVLQILFGPNFLPITLKQEELAARIVEISSDLKYPGSLTKSVLKSPNSTMAWPTALSFLAWLCCRVENSLTPIETANTDPINEIRDPASYSKVLLTESYLRLFCQILGSGGANYEDELAAYRERLGDMKNDILDFAELKRILDEQENILAQNEAREDPRAELALVEQNQVATLTQLEQRKVELKEQLSRICDMQAIEARYTTLVRSLETVKRENDALSEIIRNQKVDTKNRNDILKEIEGVQAQREIITQVNETTLRNLKNREQFFAAVQQRYYDICYRLNVASMFNENLQKLELLGFVENMERMKNNPFDPDIDTFRAWLRATRRVHRDTKKLMTDLREQTEKRIVQAQRIILRFTESEAEHENECRDLKSLANLLTANDNRDIPELEEELNKLKKEIENTGDEIIEVDLHIEDDQHRLAEITNMREKLSKDGKSHDNRLHQIEKQVSKIMQLKAQLEGPFTRAIQQVATEHMVRRGDTVKKDWGINFLQNRHPDFSDP